jgi:hypothetical protein
VQAIDPISLPSWHAHVIQEREWWTAQKQKRFKAFCSAIIPCHDRHPDMSENHKHYSH